MGSDPAATRGVSSNPVPTVTAGRWAAGHTSLPGLLTATAIVAFMVAALGSLLAVGGEIDLASLADPYVWGIVRFTLLQAGLSTLLSVAPALPIARALARRPAFPSRRAVLALLTMPLALPALVAVLGILSVWGRAGWLAQALAQLGLAHTPSIYGLTGILLAHVFFNLPFAVLVLLARLEATPGETWRLASQLGLGPRAIWWLVEWPALRAALPGLAGVILLLCATSFAIVLTLGGGPGAATLEVAIYQSLRFDFDPPRAALLAVLQTALCGVLVASLRGAAMPMAAEMARGASVPRWDTTGRLGAALDTFCIALATLLVGLPVLAVVASGVSAGLTGLLADPLVWRAAATSLAIAPAAALLSTSAAWSLITAARRSGGMPRAALDIAGPLVLAVPPFVLGAGWLVLLNRAGLAFSLAPLMVVAINALMALPFALRILGSADASLAAEHHRLCELLGLSGWSRFRLIDWPMLRGAFTFALALAASLSLGDLGIAALFGSEQLLTLPLLLQQRMGSYRIADASGLALLLALLCLGLFQLGEQVARRGRGA